MTPIDDPNTVPPASGDRSGRRGCGSSLVVAFAGVPVALMCGLFAYLLLPAVGLFGDTNSRVERGAGVVFAVAAGVAALAGPLLYGIRQRNRRVITVSALAAGVVAAAVILDAA